MADVLRIGLLFVLALLFALVEIEIEGPDGWARRLPTWYRVRPLYARLYGAFMGGKPLTGYHLFMFLVPLVAFHLPFVEGLTPSWRAEAHVLATYLAWIVAWDFLWFVLNPAFGWTRFRKGGIWWHDRGWFLRLPADYWRAGLAGAALAWLASGADGLEDYGVLIAGLWGASALSILAAPAYQRWYAHMRRPGADERGLAPGSPAHSSAAVAADDDAGASSDDE